MTAGHASGSGDLPAEEFHRLALETAEWISNYLDSVADYPVFPSIEPGAIARSLPDSPPSRGESMDRVLRDFREIVLPGINHWNHPAFFGYFAISASAPGILGEMIAAALNVNAMVWRSSPAATELEDVTTDWLRQLLGLPRGFEGVINDTASSSSLYALAAAREAAYPQVRREGLFAQRQGRVYASRQAHSSIEKAVLTLGLGHDGFHPVATDEAYRMDVAELRKAIEFDVERGVVPVAVVATLGTTSTASLDPIREIAEVASAAGAWLHVDAAYGGAAALLPEVAPRFEGWAQADTIVVNPHKWLFTPIDCSVLYCRRPETLVRAFSIVPDYLKSAEQAASRSLMDYGVSLGRRFRALKLWFVLRAFGREGIIGRIRTHIGMARRFAGWLDGHPHWTVVAPVELATVAYRFTPGWDDATAEDQANKRILDRVNASGEAFLTHTVLGGRTTLRLSIGNLRTTDEHVARVWELLREAASDESESVPG